MNATVTASKTISTIHKTFPVLNMVCAACATSVGSMLGSQEGVAKASVNYADNSTTVDYDPKFITPDDMQQAVRSVGYDLVIAEGEEATQQVEDKTQEAYQQLKKNTWCAIGLSIPLLIISMWMPHLSYANYWMWLLATPVLLVFGNRFFTGAYRQLKLGKANMDTLVALSTGTAYLFSALITLFPGFWQAQGVQQHVYFESAAVVISFILLGKLLEARARNHTSADIKKLMGLQPQTATLILNGEQQQIQVSAIQVNDQLLVRPGEAIAVDGQVKNGHPFIDESMISGEPEAVQKNPGDTLYAGTLNPSNAFEMTATAIGAQTILSRIIQLVREAQGSKAPIQKLVDKIAARFVAVVLVIALLSFFSWWVFGGDRALIQGLLAFVTVLVIACPCALGLATPAAIMVGIGKAASQGILIKDAESLQRAAKITDVVLDKTGTLTAGKLTVNEFLWLGKSAGPANTRAIHIQAFIQLEQQSGHPLAPAIIQYLTQQQAAKSRDNQDNYPSEQITGTTIIPGEGIKGTWNNPGGNRFYYAGNERLLEQQQISIPALKHEVIGKFRNSHRQDTIIYFAMNQEVLAIAALADVVSAPSKEAVELLMAQHIRVHMLTGDNQRTAEKLATEVGIDHFKAQMLPEQKLHYIADLQSTGAVVAMVGDGINDSAALAKADVSMAMAHGSAAAIDVAKITLIGADLRKIPAAIKLSRQTNRTIKENLFWAFIYNLVGIPIAAGVLYPFNGFMLNPMIAGAAMALSSISVLANSLRLKLKSNAG